MDLAAILCAALWFVTAFVIRIALQIRRTGDSGVRLRGDGSVGVVAKITFTTAIVLVGLAPVALATGLVGAITALDNAASRVAGVVFALAGIVATFVAQLAMGSSWRIGVDIEERTELVTDGVFAVVRNPIFSTMAVTSIGLFLAAPTWLGLAGLALTVLGVELQARAVEEPYLRRVHGAAYTAYEARVGRFVPTKRSRSAYD